MNRCISIAASPHNDHSLHSESKIKSGQYHGEHQPSHLQQCKTPGTTQIQLILTEEYERIHSHRMPYNTVLMDDCQFLSYTPELNMSCLDSHNNLPKKLIQLLTDLVPAAAKSQFRQNHALLTFVDSSVSALIGTVKTPKCSHTTPVLKQQQS